MPAEFLVIPSSHTDDAGQQREVEPPRLLGAAVDSHKGQEDDGGKEDPNSKHDFVELSLETNHEGPSDILRSPAGPDGQRRRTRTDTMIFSETINIAEDLAKVQTDGELEGSALFAEVPPIEEAAEVPLISEVIPSTDDVAPAPSDPSLEFTDNIPTDEVEEIPLPAVTDSEPVVPEDTGGESSDEEVVPDEEIPDPAVTEPPALPEVPVPDPPSPSDAASEVKKSEPADVPGPTQPIPEAEAQEPPIVEATPITMAEDEDSAGDEEEPTSALGPSELEAEDDDEGDDGDGGDDDDGDKDDNGPHPADEPEGGP